MGRKAIKTDDAAKAALWLVAGGFAGTLMSSLPPYTSIWGLVATIALLVFAYGRGGLPKRGLKPAAVLLALIVVFCGYKAIREYIGANYTLKYRICGAPWMPNGYVEGVIVGTEFRNDSKVDLYLHTKGRTLTALDRTSTRPIPKGVEVVHPHVTDMDDAKSDGLVDFNPQLTPQKITGHLQYDFRFGPDKEKQRRPLRVDGDYVIDFDDSHTGYDFKFLPTPESLGAYDGVCEIQAHLAATAG